VIGNAANLAARIEGVCKSYGCPILACDETVKRLRRPATTRLVDVVFVEGQERRTPIHEVFVETLHAEEPWLKPFAAGVSAYLAGEFATAQLRFADVSAIKPDDPVTDVLAQRCRELERQRPSDWTRAWKLREK
jgi:adenylate cyclase